MYMGVALWWVGGRGCVESLRRSAVKSAQGKKKFDSFLTSKPTQNATSHTSLTKSSIYDYTKIIISAGFI